MQCIFDGPGILEEPISLTYFKESSTSWENIIARLPLGRHWHFSAASSRFLLSSQTKWYVIPAATKLSDLPSKSCPCKSGKNKEIRNIIHIRLFNTKNSNHMNEVLQEFGLPSVTYSYVCLMMYSKYV